MNIVDFTPEAQLSLSPLFLQFSALKLNCTPEQYIWSQNMHRRNLTDDQRATLVFQFRDALEAEAKKQKVQSGKVTGRGNKKVLAKTPTPLPEPIHTRTFTPEAQ